MHPPYTRLTSFLLLALIGCGGGDSAPAMSVDLPPRYASKTVVIVTGKSFVPPGSTCPASTEYIRIGSLGLHTLSYTNAATGATGPVFDQLWVCNSGDGKSMDWISNPIDLAAGDNAITFTMQAGGQSASATVTIRPFGT